MPAAFFLDERGYKFRLNVVFTRFSSQRRSDGLVFRQIASCMFSTTSWRFCCGSHQNQRNKLNDYAKHARNLRVAFHKVNETILVLSQVGE